MYNPTTQVSDYVNINQFHHICTATSFTIFLFRWSTKCVIILHIYMLVRRCFWWQIQFSGAWQKFNSFFPDPPFIVDQTSQFANLSALFIWNVSW